MKVIQKDNLKHGHFRSILIQYGCMTHFTIFEDILQISVKIVKLYSKEQT